MKYFFLLIMFFSVSAFASDDEYKLIGSTDRLVYFVDMSTLNYDDETDSFQFKLRSVYRQTEETKKQPIKFTLEQVVVLCKTRVFISGSTVFFSGNKIVETAQPRPFEVYQEYEEGSLAHTAVIGLCDISKSPGTRLKDGI